jgi:hypothetical protein
MPAEEELKMLIDWNIDMDKNKALLLRSSVSGSLAFGFQLKLLSDDALRRRNEPPILRGEESDCKILYRDVKQEKTGTQLEADVR